MTHPVWEANYQAGRYNRYPYDDIVSFVLSRFGAAAERSAVRILDLGCGGGNNTRFLCLEGFDAYAVDGAPKAVELTRQYIADCGDPDHVVQGEFTALQFPDAFFDCIVDRQSLGHNPGDVIDQIVRELRRVLKSGGYYFGNVFGAGHPHRCFGAHSGADGDMCDFQGGAFTRSGHVHFFTLREVMDRFRSFELEDIVLRTSRSVLGGLDSRYNSESLLIIARKP